MEHPASPPFLATRYDLCGDTIDIPHDGNKPENAFITARTCVPTGNQSATEGSQGSSCAAQELQRNDTDHPCPAHRCAYGVTYLMQEMQDLGAVQFHKVHGELQRVCSIVNHTQLRHENEMHNRLPNQLSRSLRVHALSLRGGVKPDRTPPTARMSFPRAFLTTHLFDLNLPWDYGGSVFK